MPIIIQRNGETKVITGWRASLIGAALFVGLTLAFAFVAFVILGIAVTVGAILLIVVPVAIGVALIASVFNRRQ